MDLPESSRARTRGAWSRLESQTSQSIYIYIYIIEKSLKSQYANLKFTFHQDIPKLVKEFLRKEKTRSPKTFAALTKRRQRPRCARVGGQGSQHTCGQGPRCARTFKVASGFFLSPGCKQETATQHLDLVVLVKERTGERPTRCQRVSGLSFTRTNSGSHCDHGCDLSPVLLFTRTKH